MAMLPFVVLFVVGAGTLVRGLGGGDVDPAKFIEQFLPPHVVQGARDPLGGAEHLLSRVATQGGRLSLVALPLFLWFATRFFAGIRGSLNFIFGAEAALPSGGHLIRYLKGKVLDLGMVLSTLGLLTVNALLSGGLALAAARGAQVLPGFAFFVTTLGRLLGELLAFGFLFALFVLLYRYASFRRLEWGGTLVASLFAALGFELAKRLFGLYLTRVVSLERISVDADIGAVLLAMLWMWYTAVVFLIGAVVGDTWEHPEHPHRPSSLLT